MAYLERNADALTRPVAGGQSTAAIAEVQALHDRLERLARLVADGSLEPEDYAASTKVVRASLGEAEARMHVEARRTASVALVTSGDIRQAWEALDTEGRRAVVVELIDRVTIDRGRSGPFTPDGIEVTWRA